MNLANISYETDLRPIKRRFWMATALFLAASLALVSQIRQSLDLEQTRLGLERAESGLDRLRKGTLERKKALATLKARSLGGAANASPERILYERIDDVNARFHPDDTSVSPIENKGGEVTLPFSLTFLNPDYNNFLNAVSYLEGATNPASQVSSLDVALTETGGKTTLACSVKGKLVTSAKARP